MDPSPRLDYLMSISGYKSHFQVRTLQSAFCTLAKISIVVKQLFVRPRAINARLVVLVGCLSLAGPACTAIGGSQNPDAQDPPPDSPGEPPFEPVSPFEPVGPEVYVPKVKSLLTGLAASDDEIKSVVRDPNALRGLIDQWMETPSFKVRMLDFFRNAFQQNQVNFSTIFSTLGVTFLNTNRDLTSVIERNLMDSFPFTAWQLMTEGRPFTETITTNRYMLTTGMMALMSYLDDVHVSDQRTTLFRLAARNPIARYTMDLSATHSTADSLNPLSPNYMVWPVRNFRGASPPQTCTTKTVTSNASGGFYQGLFELLLGRANPCSGNTNYMFAPQYADADWNDWRMVTLNVAPPGPSSAAPSFYEITRLRRANALTLHTQRLGFFGTLAFAANWATNAANDARVTANQALIVALGATASGGATGDFPLSPSDAEHANNPACVGCHLQLDPLKQFFRQSYTLYYSDQTDNAQITEPAGFSFGGINARGQGVGDLARILAEHPRFALAWAQKLHFWATSTDALEDDPELTRIAEAFRASNFNFKTLVRELFSAPLITLERRTQTTNAKGIRLSIARRDQFCASLSARLGLPDVCGMNSTKPTSTQATVSARAIVMPVDGYYRGFALPSLPTRPDLFYRQSAEAVCGLVANQVIDVTTGSKYSSQNADAALDDFVATVMNVAPSDARAAEARAILADNYAAAIKANATPTAALKSTFTLACLAPSSVLVGL